MIRFRFKMQGSKDEFIEQREWESIQDPLLLKELIEDYLHDLKGEKKHGN